jgi:hypothetical protein
MVETVVSEVVEVTITEKEAGIKASKRLLEMIGFEGMMRCPDCGCATDNLDLHWTHCPFQKERPMVTQNVRASCKRGT